MRYINAEKYPAVDSHGRKRTPWAVICRETDYIDDPELSHGLVYLTQEEYMRQLSVPDALWKCPICRCSAVWDDDNYEKMTRDEGDGEGC